MPELPEVECVRRGISKARIESPVVRVWRSRKTLRTGRAWARRNERLRQLHGARPVAIVRRGKYLLWQFEHEDGIEPLGLLVHLGMSGRCTIGSADEPKLPHTHFALAFEDGREFRFVDPRRFGGLRASSWARLFIEDPIGRLGPEPLSRAFDGDVLRERAGRSRRALRDILLDQRVVAGIGNIYALEALYRAGLNPITRGDRLQPSAWRRLASEAKAVLRAGIRRGGTTLRDYRGVEGQPGRFGEVLRVYGRAGERCRCGQVLVGFELGGRGGVFCPGEQPDQGRRRVD